MKATQLQMAYVGALAGIQCTLTMGGAPLRILSLSGAGVIPGPRFVWVSNYMRGTDLGRGLALGLSVLIVLGASAYLFWYFFGEEIFGGTPVLCPVLYAALFPAYGIVLGLLINPVQDQMLPVVAGHR